MGCEFISDSNLYELHFFAPQNLQRVNLNLAADQIVSFTKII